VQQELAELGRAAETPGLAALRLLVAQQQQVPVLEPVLSLNQYWQARKAWPLVFVL